MKIGDLVWRNDYGVGKVVGFESCLAPCLVYFYKENPSLHNGAIGPNTYYWLGYAKDLKLISSVRTLIERKQHG